MVLSLKIFHIADLHIGKRVNGYSMLEDQAYILEEIVQQIKIERPQVLLIAGDIYDLSVPSAEAVRVFDDFLDKLKDLFLKVYIIAGNHDSKERLSFGSSILRKHDFFIEGNFDGHVFVDHLEEVDIYCVPFLKPYDVRHLYETEIKTYQDVFETVLANVKVNPDKFNILVAHQFITHQSHEPLLSDSESIHVGGIEDIDTSVFNDFDYVALGHIHRPQRIGRDTIRYAGSILKYSKSEVNYPKKITVLDVNKKEVALSYLDLKPLREMRHHKGYLEDLLSDESLDKKAYTFVTLLDEDEMIDAWGRLKDKFPLLMQLEFENKRTQIHQNESLSYENLEKMDPLTLFDTFYERQNNMALNKTQKEFVRALMEELDETN